MKHTTFAVLLLSLVLWGCSESSTTSKKSDSSLNPYCVTNPTAYGCGTTTGTPTCSSTDYATVGSTCFCSINTTHSSCGGGSNTGGTNPGGPSYGTIPSDNSWTGLYNGPGKPSVPTATCSAPTGTGYGTRKGTITMAFQKDTTVPVDDYSPALSGLSSFTNNVSSFLANKDDAKMFIDTDALLKVRLMPRPQPKPSAGNVYCYGRRTGAGSGTAYGYSKLSFAVSVRAVNTDGSLGPHQGTQYLTTNINSCSPGLDYSGYAQSAPNGLVLVVHDVYSDQSCSYFPCDGWSQTTTTCWQMDVEVAVDGTKTF